MKAAALNDFVFRGLLASYCRDELQRDGVLRTPESTVRDRKDQDLFAPVPDVVRTGSLFMQRHYRVLYVFENLVREFVTARFLDLGDEEWFDARATSAMKKKVEDRQKRELKNQWHIGRNEDPIYFLDFGDLGLLIINHWDAFKDFFDNNQAWVLSRLQDAEKTRNVIAHTNDLDAEEGHRLRMHLRDWIRQIS